MSGKGGNNDKSIETIIGKNAEIKGNIITQGSVRIKGNLEGDIEAEGDVYIGESGSVNSGIKGENIIIKGEVKGNIKSNEKLELLSGAVIKGDITAKILKIEEGAIFNGTSKMNNNGNQKIKTNFEKAEAEDKPKNKN